MLSDGAELPLPAVGVRDLPQLAAASGGRLPDPAGD
ncbi:MAG: PH domain-containing protein [Pseudonocardia sp.]|nr:PH domain-containing protein [Pseudonocardia sp.]